MAMAQRKDRSIWSLDPQGTTWANDENKFGFRMLQAMGWQKGKGLGAHGTGGFPNHRRTNIFHDLNVLFQMAYNVLVLVVSIG
eukprot:gene308-3677_t